MTPGKDTLGMLFSRTHRNSKASEAQWRINSILQMNLWSRKKRYASKAKALVRPEYDSGEWMFPQQEDNHGSKSRNKNCGKASASRTACFARIPRSTRWASVFDAISKWFRKIVSFDGRLSEILGHMPTSGLKVRSETRQCSGKTAPFTIDPEIAHFLYPMSSWYMRDRCYSKIHGSVRNRIPFFLPDGLFYAREAALGSSEYFILNNIVWMV